MAAIFKQVWRRINGVTVRRGMNTNPSSTGGYGITYGNNYGR